MAKEKNAVAGSLFRELFQLGVYKRNQGRIARQVTFAALAVVFVVGVWRLHSTLSTWHPGRWLGVENIDAADRFVRLGVCGVLLLAALWFAYRLVNLPSFADFLIAVEAEMNKVSWPTRLELFRSCVVVIFCIFFLTAVLFAYDVFWRELLQVIGVINAA